MNSKDYDRDRWSHLTPAERVRLRLMYRSYRKIFGLDRIIARCVVHLTVAQMAWALQDRGVWDA